MSKSVFESLRGIKPVRLVQSWFDSLNQDTPSQPATQPDLMYLTPTLLTGENQLPNPVRIGTPNQSVLVLYRVARTELPTGQQGVDLLRATADVPEARVPYLNGPARAAGQVHGVLRAACPATWHAVRQKLDAPDTGFGDVIGMADTAVPRADFGAVFADQQRGRALLRACTPLAVGAPRPGSSL